ncbi:reverse transcriptase family protein [Treponema zuelzerae]|uniref:RNA-directed DNA polymerase n=1 Tax=Teretinema zuelzerae TaxID=156 RepID=A0AAE3JJJ8_9SPIR|nr:reverse transcriptase domain-containing protein [Teretinema zuelzerae]MCD1655511.1 reverse transcriptase family protein [Teretinema zuelzerae]
MEKLIDAQNRSDLAISLGYKPQTLTYILFQIPADQKYESWTIPKKNGGFREIKSPNEKLKLLQRRVGDQLYAIFNDNVLVSQQELQRQLIHGYIKHRSCITNARRHVRKRYILNVDLKDFFPTINFGRVRGFFISSKIFKLDKSVATVLAQIICDNNELPQGSPSSPIMSNLIASVLDARLVQLAKKSRCTYTRYVDDITFSTNMKCFPKELAKKNENGIWQIGKVLRKEIERAGFLYNPEKISVQYRRSRQVVTGLVVNKSVNVPKEYYKNLRAACKALFGGGIPYDKLLSPSGRF